MSGQGWEAVARTIGSCFFHCQGNPDSPMPKTSPLNAEGAGLIPSQGTRILHNCGQKTET